MKIFNNKCKVFYIISVVLLCFSFGCRKNDVLVTYDKGVIKRNELRELVNLYGLQAQAQQASFQKKLVKQMVLMRILNEKITKDFPHYYSEDTSKQFFNMLALSKLFERQWEKKQEGIAEKFYHIQALLIRKGKDKDVISSDDVAFNKLLEVRHYLMKDKRSIVKELTKDKAIKDIIGKAPRYRIFNFKPISMIPSGMQSSILRLTEKVKGVSARVVQNKVTIYDKADQRSKVLSVINKNVVLTLLEPVKKQQTPKKWAKCMYIELTSGLYVRHGYVEMKNIQTLGKETFISYPVTTSYGWLIFSISKLYNIHKEDFSGMLEKSNKKNTLSEGQANFYWQNTLFVRKKNWQYSLFQSYGIPDIEHINLDSIQVQLKGAKYLVKTDKIEITSKFFYDYLNVVYVNDLSKIKHLLKDKKQLKEIYKNFIKHYVFSLEAKKMKLNEHPELARLIEWDTMNFMVHRYMMENWYNTIEQDSKEASNKLRQIFVEKEQELLKKSKVLIHDSQMKDGEL